MASGPIDIVTAFNDAINARDLDALVALMSDHHRFVDSAGGVVAGRAACREAWAGFFEAFPDYRNVVERVEAGDGGSVVVHGRSECSTEPLLHGPAVWHATVAEGLVTEWRVEDPSP